MISPGFYRWYPSNVVSEYWCWFKLLGYPQLDIMTEDDGTWYIIQYLNSPLIYSEVRWNVVLGPMKNVEKSFSFCQKYIKEIDLQRKEAWAREEEKTRKALEEAETTAKRDKEFAERMTDSVVRNPDLMNRIAKNGLSELNMLNLAKHVPSSEIVTKPKGKKIDVPSPSQPTN